MQAASRHSIFEDSIPRRLVVDRCKRAKMPSSHGLRIVAAHLTPAVAKFAFSRAAKAELEAYQAHFAWADMVAPR
jgi:hypothetical protein